ncbi:RNA polymerase sigma factor RpoE [Minicystis rosea]|nr:RNA polymerase sigma factor RpoE [Minicystis rosea]
MFTEHASAVWRFLRWFGVRERDLDDACQDVFIVVHRKLSTYDGCCSVRTWLYGVCRRVAADHRRSAHLAREELVASLPEVSEPPPQDAEIERRAARQLLEKILDTMDDDKRFVLVLHEIEQVPMEDIAALLGCPVQTAYSRHRAAMKHIEAAVKRLRRDAA